jgi:hypothetical protein
MAGIRAVRDGKGTQKLKVIGIATQLVAKFGCEMRSHISREIWTTSRGYSGPRVEGSLSRTTMEPHIS